MTVGVAGLGLIGGSIGLAMRAAGHEVVGWDPSDPAQNLAKERQCVDRLGSLAELAAASVVFIAAPPEKITQVADELFSHTGPETVITDCASVKSVIASWAESNKRTMFVGGHPMAGHEKSGAGYSSAWMFRGSRWLLTPVKSTSKAAIKVVADLVKEIGATPVRIQAENHDHHVAVLSHLPHALAAHLVLMGAELEMAEIGAGSWRDLTRVGGVDPGLWTQIFLGNRQELAKVLRGFSGRLDELAQALDSGDEAHIHKVFADAKVAKTAQDKEAAAQAPKTPMRAIRKKR